MAVAESLQFCQIFDLTLGGKVIQWEPRVKHVPHFQQIALFPHTFGYTVMLEMKTWAHLFLRAHMPCN